MTETTWTVSQLGEWLDAVVARSLGGEIWVEGEISNLSRSGAGHVYFNLIERSDGSGPSPSLAITLFDWHRTNVNHLLRRAGGSVRMDDGVRVRVRGEVRLYPARSQYQLRMTSIDPSFTLGNLAAERAALLARLDADGLLAANRSLPAPTAPLRLALITSVDSAAAADALHELAVSGLGFEVILVDSRVQGTEAPASLVQAITRAHQVDPDLILVVRGGGARTDLAAFDDEAVARSIAGARIPVWCGLGHETDRSVADEVAHQSFKTPTACAAAAVEALRQAQARSEAAWQGAAHAAERALRQADSTLRHRSAAVAIRTGGSIERATHRIGRQAVRLSSRAERTMTDAEHRLVRTDDELRRRSRSRLDGADDRLERAAALMRAHDPSRTLARGWSITRTATGELVRDGSCPVGTSLVTTLAGGTLQSEVVATSPPATTVGGR